jgi:signal transduction histidine kinase
VNRFDPARHAASHYECRAGDPTSLSSNEVTALFVDYTGVVWAGTSDGGVHRYIRSKDAFERVALRDARAVRAIDEDKVGNVWIGTSDGIFRYSRPTAAVKHYAIVEKGEHNPRVSLITSIAVDNEGVVWVGTEGAGAGRYDAGKDAFEQVTESAGLPDDWVKGIIADRRGGLWLATSKGIARYDPGKHASRIYGIEAGVQGDAFSGGAYAAGKSGRFYFGGANGLNWFIPESLRENTTPPPVFITSMKLGDAGIPLQVTNGEIDDIHLPSAQGTVTFEFLALDYTSPERNRVAYRLEGFDSAWTIVAGHGVARYSNLGKGEYTLQVRGSNSDGVWNEAGGTLRLIVHQQWWDHWWVRVSSILGIAALPFAFYAYRNRKAANSDRSRIRMVRELHDEVNATLSGIDYYSEVVRTGVKQNDEQRVDKYLSLIREGASAAQDSVADIIWTVNPGLEAWDQLLAQFRRFATDMFERRAIRHAIVIPEDLSIPPFALEKRRKFWLLYKEILLTVVQLSSSKLIAVKLTLEENRRLNLVVAGDGDGVDDAQQAYRDALGRIRSRTEDLHCALEVDHPPEGGTTWKVYFPPG